MIKLPNINLNLDLFKKKVAKGKEAPIIEVLSDDGGQKGLAFGLFWRKLVTSGGRDEAVKIARTAVATHYIFHLQQIGFGKISDKPESLPRRIYPASVIAARHFMGDSLCLLEIEPGEYWIALTRNGQPTSVDFLLKGAQTSEALSEVRRVLSENSEDETGAITVYTNVENHGLENARELAAYDLFDAAIDDDEAFLQLPKARASVPLPVIYAAGFLGLALIAQSGYKMYDQKVRAKLNAAAAAQGLDPQVAWTQVIETWKGSASAPDPQGMELARESIGKLPVDWKGWSLSAATCKAGKLAGNVRDWACKAAYTRKPSGILTQDLIKEVPEGWTANFTPLNELELTWVVSQPSSPIDLAGLGSIDKVRVRAISQLQRLQMALTEEPKFQFEQIALDAPHGADGSALPADPRMAGLSKASLSIKGPLRSIDAVTNTGLEVDWNEITIARNLQEAKPTLLASVITANATGIIYAKK